MDVIIYTVDQCVSAKDIAVALVESGHFYIHSVKVIDRATDDTIDEWKEF